MKWVKSQMTNETILKTPQEDIVKMVLNYVEKEGIEIVKDQPQEEQTFEFFPLVDYINGYNRHRLKLSSGMAGDFNENKIL
jgi:hypothetical protein